MMKNKTTVESKTDVKEVFCKNLSIAVSESGLTYASVAEKLGVTKATMSMYKHGKALPSLETFSILCDILGESADFLLGKKDY